MHWQAAVLCHAPVGDVGCSSQAHLTQVCVFVQAAMLEYNLEAADAAIQAVREALASGLDWRELGQMIKAERRAGNPVAGLIESLQVG